MCLSNESSIYEIEIESIIYDGYMDMYIATLENGERWAVPRYAVPKDMHVYDFMKEIIMKQNKTFGFIYNPHSDEYEFWCNQNLLVTLSGKYVASKKNENENFGECFRRLCGEYFWEIACYNPQFSTRSLITHVFANKYQTDID